MARTGAQSTHFPDFHEKVTFGAEMSSKVTFLRFWSPKSDFSRPGSQMCLWAMVSLMFFGPRELKCNFFAQKSLLRTSSHFGAQKSFFRESSLLGPKSALWVPRRARPRLCEGSGQGCAKGPAKAGRRLRPRLCEGPGQGWAKGPAKAVRRAWPRPAGPCGTAGP